MQQTDNELLHEYASTRNRAILDELIARHVDLVYSVARRKVRDAHLAEDVTQSVFIVLLQKAPRFRPDVRLEGWLFRTTCYLAANALKMQQRRRRYERAAMTSELDDPQPPLAPDELALLDSAIARLNEAQRSAILLRFHRAQPLKAVGAALGISEDAARKLVDRALAKLRSQLAGGGVACSAAGISSAMCELAKPAPEAFVRLLPEALTSQTPSLLAQQLAKGAFIMQTMTRIKIAAAIIAAILLAGGATAVVYSQSQSRRISTATPQPAKADTAAPAPAQTDATTPRGAVYVFVEALAQGDGGAIRNAFDTSDPNERTSVEALADFASAGARMGRVMESRYGKDQTTFNVFGLPAPVQTRQQIPTLPVRINGDRATVNFFPGANPKAIQLRQIDGQWRILASETFEPGKPKASSAPAAAMMKRVTMVFTHVADQVEAGKYASRDEAMQDMEYLLREAQQP